MFWIYPLAIIIGGVCSVLIVIWQNRTAVPISIDSYSINTSTQQLTSPSKKLRDPSPVRLRTGGSERFSNQRITCPNTNKQREIVLHSIKKSSDLDKYLIDGDITTIEEVITMLSSKEWKDMEMYPKDKKTPNINGKLAECYLYLAGYSDDEGKIQEYINNGIDACHRVSQLDTDNQEINKCYTELYGLKLWVRKSDDEKRKFVNLYVHHAKIAFAFNPQDSRLYHILGRLLYELIAFFNFDTMNITYDDVLSCFHIANYLPTVCPRERKENIMFIGKCYFKTGNSDKGFKYLEKAGEIGSNSQADICLLNRKIDRLINIERARLKTKNALKSLNSDMVDNIKSTITVINPLITWDDIIGLKEVKEEMKYELGSLVTKKTPFEKDCESPRGILLSGPPGTGKTFIDHRLLIIIDSSPIKFFKFVNFDPTKIEKNVGKCIGSQIKCTFFNISSSSLTSKWFGDGEKMVRTLFAVARCHQPAVIFIDEIDGLLSSRNSSDHDVSRRMKTEFLTEMDGVSTNKDEQVFIIGATNRPQDIDQSVMRRFRYLQVPLPDGEARLEIFKKKLSKTNHALSDRDFEQMINMSKQYSIGDLNRVLMVAQRIRKMELHQGKEESYKNLRPIRLSDFEIAFGKIKPSVSPKDLKEYEDWCKNRNST